MFVHYGSLERRRNRVTGKRETGQDRGVVVEQVAEAFGLGRPTGEPVRVVGGLSNELWRVDTSEGAFAVKRMIVNADRPDFVRNVEASFAVERRALLAGVPMPEPVAADGRALVRVDESLYRVHRWVDGRPGKDSVAEATGLLAAIHRAGDQRWAPPPGQPWLGERWDHEVQGLARRVAELPERLLIVDSHRDLDQPNTLLTPDGTLLAVDWDAAGPIGLAHEAVGFALDWSHVEASGFGSVVGSYLEQTGAEVPAEPWVFAGWVAGLGGWLDYNATHRADTPLGAAEVSSALAHLHSLAADLDGFLSALRG